jgi:hypothetical protein
MQKVCVICGVVFEAVRKAKTCSPECREANRLQRNTKYNNGTRVERVGPGKRWQRRYKLVSCYRRYGFTELEDGLWDIGRQS